MQTASARALAVPELLDLIIGYAQCGCSCSLAPHRAVSRLWDDLILARLATIIEMNARTALCRCPCGTKRWDLAPYVARDPRIYRHARRISILSLASQESCNTEFMAAMLTACSAARTLAIDTAAADTWQPYLGVMASRITTLCLNLSLLEPEESDWPQLASIRNLQSLSVIVHPAYLDGNVGELQLIDMLLALPVGLGQFEMCIEGFQFLSSEALSALSRALVGLPNLVVFGLCTGTWQLRGVLQAVPTCLKRLKINSCEIGVLATLALLADPAFLPNLFEVEVKQDFVFSADGMITERDIVQAIQGVGKRRSMETINYNAFFELISLRDDDIPDWSADSDVHEGLGSPLVEDEDGKEEDASEICHFPDSADEDSQTSESSDSDAGGMDEDHDPDLHQEIQVPEDYEEYYDMEQKYDDDEDCEEEEQVLEDELPVSSPKHQPEYLDDLDEY